MGSDGCPRLCSSWPGPYVRSARVDHTQIIHLLETLWMVDVTTAMHHYSHHWQVPWSTHFLAVLINKVWFVVWNNAL